jgi:hypothetical protein
MPGDPALHTVIDAYLDVKERLIRSSTDVLGAFISEAFLHDMLDGAIHLLEGLTCQDARQAEHFHEAAATFTAMGREGGLELTREYLQAFEEQRLDALAGLFPEHQEALLGPFNQAVEIYNRADKKEFAGSEALTQLVEAISCLRQSELARGGISTLDVKRRLIGTNTAMWQSFSKYLLYGNIAFFLYRLITWFGGISQILGA